MIDLPPRSTNRLPALTACPIGTASPGSSKLALMAAGLRLLLSRSGAA